MIQYLLNDDSGFTQQFGSLMRAFYAEHGQWPVWKKRRNGEYLAVTKQGIHGETNNRDPGATDDR
jgi:hypothetical protein